MKKRMLHVFIMFCSMMVVFVMMPVFAEEVQETVEIDASEWIYQAGGWGYSDEADGPLRPSTQAVYDRQGAVDRLIEGMKACEETVSLREWGIPKSDMEGIFVEAVNSSPELFYVQSQCTMQSSYGIVVSIHLKYTEKYFANLAYYQAEFEAGVQRALDYAKDAKTKEEKALMLHDYLAINIVYDSATADNLDPSAYGNRDAYTALVEGSTVCQGYALAYKLLMDECGIPCEYVSSKQMNHAWNAIQLEGEWYQVDVTWDDPTPDRAGYVRHFYFLRSDTGMKQSASGSGKYHHDWNFSIPCIDDEKYQSAFWNKLTAPVIYVGDAVYYIDPDYTEPAGALLKRNKNTDPVVLYKFETWPSQRGHWIGNFSGLSYNNDSLYWNDNKNVYQQKIGSEVSAKVYTEGTDNIYGSCYTTKGQMALCMGTTPNTAKTQIVTISEPPVFAGALGDVNHDGKVSVTDLAIIKRHIMGKFPDIDMAAADVTGDGKITVRDLAKIKQLIMGKITTLE